MQDVEHICSSMYVLLQGKIFGKEYKWDFTRIWRYFLQIEVLIMIKQIVNQWDRWKRVLARPYEKYGHEFVLIMNICFWEVFEK